MCNEIKEIKVACSARPERNRRARRRRKLGLIVLPVEVAEVDLVELLVEKKLLPECDRENRAAISEALSTVLATLIGTRTDMSF